MGIQSHNADGDVNVRIGALQILLRSTTPTVSRGFTLIELIVSLVIVVILSSFAVPMYLDYKSDALRAAADGARGGIQTAIQGFEIWSATDSGGGNPRFPTVAELATPDVVVQGELPPNPYDNDGVPNNVVDATGQSMGTIIGTSGGWAYNPVTGLVWANSAAKLGL